ncbi:hypothetical protein [Actinoallomurus bryophytorum]|uniref:hypothetical protein n=1 Tax=Actinoallomurus bryophytorum TaxID=1490222 RepID=UPI00114F927B|nr:hypothetical protein [Actinoallomurus bryophytorum]
MSDGDIEPGGPFAEPRRAPLFVIGDHVEWRGQRYSATRLPRYPTILEASPVARAAPTQTYAFVSSSNSRIAREISTA